MVAEDRQWIARLRQDLAAGVPTHIQHDTHRLFGRSSTLGQMIDGAHDLGIAGSRSRRPPSGDTRDRELGTSLPMTFVRFAMST